MRNSATVACVILLQRPCTRSLCCNLILPRPRVTSVSAVTGLDIFPLFEKFCRKDFLHALIAGVLEKVKLLLWSICYAHCTFALVLASLGPAI